MVVAEHCRAPQLGFSLQSRRQPARRPRVVRHDQIQHPVVVEIDKHGVSGAPVNLERRIRTQLESAIRKIAEAIDSSAGLSRAGSRRPDDRQSRRRIDRDRRHRRRRPRRPHAPSCHRAALGSPPHLSRLRIESPDSSRSPGHRSEREEGRVRGVCASWSRQGDDLWEPLRLGNVNHRQCNAIPCEPAAHRPGPVAVPRDVELVTLGREGRAVGSKRNVAVLVDIVRRAETR